MASVHGGGQFDVIGSDLSHLSQRQEVVPADVLDAWFDPAPGVVSQLKEEAAWMCRTSPPADASGLEETIARHLGIEQSSIVVGPGSSDIIYRGLTAYLTASSRVFILDPTYSEYRHVCEKVVGCLVESGRSLSSLNGLYDLIVIVNPNNPTGELFSGGDIRLALSFLAPDGRVWIDEAYLPFVPIGESLKTTATTDHRFVVCQSLSKSLALSGMRIAYFVGTPSNCNPLRRSMPPWPISTAATMAATAALKDPDYYQSMYTKTSALRSSLAESISLLGIGIVGESPANWLTLSLPGDSDHFIVGCRNSGVLLRGGEGMFENPPQGFVRIAVRSAAENAKTLLALIHADSTKTRRSSSMTSDFVSATSRNLL